MSTTIIRSTMSTTNTSCPTPYTQDRDLFLTVPQTVLANGITQLYKNGKIPSEIQGYTIGIPTLVIDTTNNDTINITFPLTKDANSGDLILTLDLNYIAIETISQLFYVNFPGGASNYVNCSNLGTSFSSDNGFTFEAWVQMSDDGTEQTLFSIDGDTPIIMTAQISGGETTLSLTWDSKYNWTDPYTNLSDGRWHHVAVIVGNSEIYFYIDGRSLYPPVDFTGSQTANGTLKLGPSFTGHITQAAVWDIALTEKQLQQWMNADLSRTTSKPVGYWTFTALQNSKNIIGGQSVTFEGTATPQKAAQENNQDPYAIFFYTFDSASFVTLTVTGNFSSIQVNSIKQGVMSKINPYIEAAYLVSKGYSGNINIFPSIANFITLNNNTGDPSPGDSSQVPTPLDPDANQLLLPMMVVNNPPPLDRGFGYAPLTLPENIEIEITLWDYTFLKDFVEPKLEQALGVDDSYFTIDNTSDCSAAILSLSKDATSGSSKFTTLTVEIIPTPTNAVSFETKGTALNGLYNFSFQTQVDITLNADSQEILTSPKSTSSSISPTTAGGFAIAGGVIAIFAFLTIFAIIIAIVFVLLATVGVSAAFNSRVNKALDKMTNTFDLPSVGGLKIEEIAFEDKQNTLDFYGTFNAS